MSVSWRHRFDTLLECPLVGAQKWISLAPNFMALIRMPLTILMIGPSISMDSSKELCWPSTTSTLSTAPWTSLLKSSTSTTSIKLIASQSGDISHRQDQIASLEWDDPNPATFPPPPLILFYRINDLRLWGHYGFDIKSVINLISSMTTILLGLGHRQSQFRTHSINREDWNTFLMILEGINFDHIWIDFHLRNFDRRTLYCALKRIRAHLL